MNSMAKLFRIWLNCPLNIQAQNHFIFWDSLYDLEINMLYIEFFVYNRNKIDSSFDVHL